MNNPKVSVIMPSLNVVEYIRECIESVINQTLKDIEIICVDAGSTDGTLEIIQEYALKDNRIKIINSDKKSYGYQMNIGIRSAKGEYIGIVETDDFIDSNMYEELYQIARENEVDFVKEDYNCFQSKEEGVLLFPNKICSDNSLYEKKLVNQQKKIMLTTQVVIWSSLYKRSFIKNNNILFNESPGASYQDNGFWFISSVLANNVFFHHNSHYYLRRDNPNSSTATKDNVYSICDEYDYVYEFLKNNHQIYNSYIDVYWRALFNGYLFTLKRIDNKYKKEFLDLFNRKLEEGIKRKEIDLGIFNGNEKRIFKKIAHNPKKVNLLKLKQRPINTKKSNYVQRLIYCYEDNGLLYTIEHIFDRIKQKIKTLRRILNEEK